MNLIGVGKSNDHSSEKAGREAAEGAIKNFGGRSADFVLVFATAGYDLRKLVGAITATIEAPALSGCSTSGVITREGLDEGSHAVSVLALKSDAMTFKTFRADGLAANSSLCGQKLAAQIAEDQEHRGKLLLLFPDGVSGNVTEALMALEERLPYPVQIAGGTAGELLKVDRTWQFHNGTVASDSIAAVLIGGAVVPEIAISHGCEPIGSEQTVTRAQNGWVFEIDGKPAWSVYRQYLDVQELDTFSMSHSCYICLAVRLAQPHPVYGDYVIRCPLQLDRNSQALFFPGTIETGAKVRMALRSAEQSLVRTRATAKALLSRHPGAKPQLVMHFDCCCRGKLLFGAHVTETSITPLQQLFDPEIPWIGFSTYGEIASIEEGRSKPLFHNYSAILCALFPE